MSFQVDNVFWLGCDHGIIAVIMNQDNETAVKGEWLTLTTQQWTILLFSTPNQPFPLICLF